MPRKLTNEEFLEKARKKHGDKFEYPEEYVHTDIEMVIICPIHGETQQTPNNHIKSINGCNDCSNNNRIQYKIFLEKANKKHNNFYTYPNINYQGSESIIKIECPIHDEFELIAKIHAKGRGCPECENELKLKKIKKEFLEKATKVHNGKYFYPLDDYINSELYIKIICPIHKPFLQTPKNHVQGKGCPECGTISNANAQRYTNEEFIEKANIKHNNYYTYPNADYQGKDSIIKIECPIHGEFKQVATTHLIGSGCSICNSNNLKIFEKAKKEFNNKANKIHNNKYDYSKFIYSGVNINSIIICPIHGEFLKTPSEHINKKRGCKECKKVRSDDELLIKTNFFIERSNIKHNYFYDYSLVKYITDRINVIIICPIHDKFEQPPRHHLDGHGCKKCGIKKYSDAHRKTTKEFIDDAKKIHGDKYDYSLVNYKGDRTQVKIICSIHKNFPQKPHDHLRGGGCPKCGIEKAMNTIIERYGEIWKGLFPRYNPNSIVYLDMISEKLNIPIQHALNIGEKKFRRYWVDGYISEHNICIEWQERGHSRTKYKERDEKKNKMLKEEFNCEIIYIWEKEFLKDIDNQINIVVNKIKQIINN